MNFSCKKEEMVKGLQNVQAVLSSKVTLPVLSNILIETADKRLKLSATDLEVSVSSSLEADVSKPGAITVPGKMFFAIVRDLPANDMSFEADAANHIRIRSKNAVFKLTGLPKDDYPVIPQFKEDRAFSLKKDIIKDMIRKTRFSVSMDESRYVLCGIYMTIEKGKVKMVATDGKRLAYIAKPAVSDKKQNVKIIIPSKAINELSKILEEEEDEKDGNIFVAVDENQVIFKVASSVLVSRLIDGHYPNYEQVIPKSSTIQAVMDTEALLRATKRVSLFTSEKLNTVKFIFKKNKLIMTATIQGVGEAQDEMEIEYSGEEIEIGYNPAYVVDVLTNLGSKKTRFALTNALNPGVIRSDDSEEYLAVIMPMRI